MQATALQSAPAEHAYYAKWLGRHRWMIFLYLAIGAYNVIDGILTHSRWNLIIGVYFLVLAPLTTKSWYSNYLVVTPGGISYHSGRAVLEVPWQDMEYIGHIKMRGWYSNHDGIILRKAEWKRPRRFWWPKTWRPKFIPLWSKWTGPWWDRELFDEVFYYAPWLAGEGRNGTVSQ
ncbi:MAG: hypothetical protein ACR2JW_11435 [Thermomicrobiales bacterium]